MATKALKAVTVEQALDELDKTRNIAQRIAAVMGEVDYVQKEKKQGMNYSIVSHDAVTAKVRPLLHKHGIVYYPRALTVSQNGNRTEAVFTVRFENIDNREDYIDVETFGYGVDPQDKGPGKAMSYGVKYALLKVLGLETGDDPDTVQDNRADYQPPHPSTGETPPRKRVTLDGPYDTVPKLERAAREFARTLRSMSSVEEFENWKQDTEVKAFVEQCKRDLPGWWFANHPDCPPDFIPLAVEVANTKRGLAELEEINARNPA
jgi:hypothetical protein